MDGRVSPRRRPWYVAVQENVSEAEQQRSREIARQLRQTRAYVAELKGSACSFSGLTVRSELLAEGRAQAEARVRKEVEDLVCVSSYLFHVSNRQVALNASVDKQQELSLLKREAIAGRRTVYLELHISRSA